MLEDKNKVQTFARDFGLLLHLPAILSLPTFVIIVIFKEWAALQGFFIMSVASLIAGQLLYQPFKHREASNFSSNVVLVALAWLAIPLLGAFPFWYTATIMNNSTEAVEVFKVPVNAIFESMSGFTSTGLSMVKNPAQLMHTLQWWRSFSQWTGGLGIIFLSFFLLDTQHSNKGLYEAEARSWIYDGKLRNTIKNIFSIYIVYTLLTMAIFYLLGMPLWEAVNHGLTAISTGGFAITNNSFTGYNTSIKAFTIAVMIVGSISFKVHFLLLVQGKFKQAGKQTQLRYFFLFYVTGLLFAWIVNGFKGNINLIFQWTSALGTCGFSTADISKWSPSILFLLIIAMIIGGNANSTTGGLKTERAAWLIKYLIWFVNQSLKENTAMKIKYDDTLVYGNEAIEKFQKVAVILFLWILALAGGTLLLSVIVEDQYDFEAILFETASALSSVGLSTGIATATLSRTGKIVLIILMWIGRLEIYAALVLLIFPFSLLKRKFRTQVLLQQKGMDA